ncbi:hypothetical protein CRYUN_Cryun06bG0069700 [Craigia yunnanensis]
MEAEATALREMQAKVEKEMGSIQDPAAAVTSQANREEVDSRSVFVGNVDYSCTPEEVQLHFQSCGTVNRITSRTDKYGQPKGYAYVEFLEAEAVQEALLLNESELHGRQLKEGSKVENGNALQPLLLNTWTILGSSKRILLLSAFLGLYFGQFMKDLFFINLVDVPKLCKNCGLVLLMVNYATMFVALPCCLT